MIPKILFKYTSNSIAITLMSEHTAYSKFMFSTSGERGNNIKKVVKGAGHENVEWMNQAR
jgi:hypothetical protein